jgi:hypothetical protein
LSPQIDFNGPLGDEIQQLLLAISAMQKVVISKDLDQLENVTADLTLALHAFDEAIEHHEAGYKEAHSPASATTMSLSK